MFFDDSITALSCSPDGKLCAVGFKSGKIKIINCQTYRLRYEFSSFNKSAVSYLRLFDEERMLSADEAGDLVYYFQDEPRAGGKKRFYRPVLISQLKETITALAANRDGTYIAAGTASGVIYSYAFTCNKTWESNRLIGHSQAISSLQLSDCQTSLISGSADTTIKLWDVFMNSCMGTFHGHCARITSAHITPDRRILYSSSRDQTVIVWNVQSGEIIEQFGGHRRWIEKVVAGYSAYYNTVIFIACSDDGIISFHTPGAQDSLYTSSIVAHRNSWINGLVLLSDTQTLISYGADGCVKIWDFATWQLLQSVARKMPRGRLCDESVMIEHCLISEDEKTMLWSDDSGGLTFAALV